MTREGWGGAAQALADVERLRPINVDSWYWPNLAYVYGRSGQTVQARHALEELQRLSRRQRMDPAAFVRAYIALGDKEQAFVWLEKAYSQHSSSLTALKVDPAYDPLRSDPRFQDLVRRVGLGQ